LRSFFPFSPPFIFNIYSNIIATFNPYKFFGLVAHFAIPSRKKEKRAEFMTANSARPIVLFFLLLFVIRQNL